MSNWILLYYFEIEGHRKHRNNKKQYAMEPLNKKQKIESVTSNEKNEYSGYSIPKDSTATYKVDVLSFKDLLSGRNLDGCDDGDVSKWFHENYIKSRKPCKIVDCDVYEDINGIYRLLDKKNIEKSLVSKHSEEEDDDDEEEEEKEEEEEEEVMLQVEQAAAGGFGSGNKRLRMSFKEFWQKVCDSSETDNLYLTTQYVEDPYLEHSDNEPTYEEKNDEDEEDDDDKEEEEEARSNIWQGSEADSITFDNLQDDYVDSDAEVGDENSGEYIDMVEEVYQKPLSSLVDQIPFNLNKLTKTLLTQQINLWIGSTKNNKDKDLLFWSKLLEKINSETQLDSLGKHVVGKKLSSGLHHDHADNIYIPVSGEKQFTIYPPDCAYDLYTVGDIKNIYHNGVINYEQNANAPKWCDINEDGTTSCNATPYSATHDEETKVVDPPSFSRINPIFVHLEELKELSSELYDKAVALGRTMYPQFFNKDLHETNKKLVINLQKNEVLYLPSGWFHEVSSKGDLHIAMNYWFTPPNTSSKGELYDKELYEQYETTEKAKEWYIENILNSS